MSTNQNQRSAGDLVPVKFSRLTRRGVLLGLSLTGSQLQQSLKCVGLLFGRRDRALREQFADTVIAFHSHADDFGPYDFYTHASAVREPTMIGKPYSLDCPSRREPKPPPWAPARMTDSQQETPPPAPYSLPERAST